MCDEIILELKGKNKDFWVNYPTPTTSKTIWANCKAKPDNNAYPALKSWAFITLFLGVLAPGKCEGLIKKWLNSETEKSPTLSTSINLHDKRNIATHLVKYSRPVKKYRRQQTALHFHRREIVTVGLKNSTDWLCILVWKCIPALFVDCLPIELAGEECARWMRERHGTWEEYSRFMI